MKRQAVILVVLIAALGYLGYVYWPILSSYVAGPAQKGPELRKEAASKTTTTIARAEAGSATQEVEEDEESKAAEKIKLVDPFSVRITIKTDEPAKIPEKEVRTVPDPVLEGIWVDSDMKVAFISGQALIEGGKILGWTVKRITKTQVLLVKGRQRKILKLEGIQ